MDKRVEQIGEINSYFVKVADSCPIVIEKKKEMKM